MDPNDCYLRWLTARVAEECHRENAKSATAKADEARAEARETADDLLHWIRRGGAEPRWTERQRVMFFDQTGGL